jgi:hypothetical protein
MAESCCRRRVALQGKADDAEVMGYPVRYTPTGKGVIAHVLVGSKWINLGVYGGPRWPRAALEKRIVAATVAR